MLKKLSNEECVDMMVNMDFDESFDICTEENGSDTYMITRTWLADGDYFLFLYYGGGSSELVDVTWAHGEKLITYLLERLKMFFDYHGIKATFLKREVGKNAQ